MVNIEEIEKKYEQIDKELAQSKSISNWEKIGKLRKEKQIYETVIAKQKEIEKIEKQIKEAEKILVKEKDPGLILLANQEKIDLPIKKNNLEKEISSLLKELNGEEAEPKSIIVEIRAGAGGDEASLFAADLFNMYSKYAENQNWQVKILNGHRTELGGYKEIAFQVSGPKVFSKMKHEAGVHRVQRIPSTEKQGRIHTSTASVAILTRPKKNQIKIKPDELQIDTYKSSGPGGQNVNKRETAIRITHLPSGIVVTSQNERNQAQNKENALAILQAKLFEAQEEQQAEKIDSNRKKQIGQNKRAEKIRTYNFPQDRVTDHRIKKTWHNLQDIMEGGLDVIVKDLEELKE